MPNSADSLPSERRRRVAEALGVAALLCVLVTVAAWWFFRNGYILYYGDAQSHLNISRSIIDSRTPGYDQLGNVWLPVLHVICLPFVGNNWLWHTGLAGTIPVAMCLVIAGTFFFLAAQDAYGSAGAAAVVVSCFVLNPNVLYLSSIPMTEVVFLAALAVLLFALLRFRATQKLAFVVLGLLACWWMSLTRYDGWFLIPFAAIWFAAFAAKRPWVVLLLFGALASLPPLYWIAHNWWETGNALDFFNGPYSAKAIQGSQPYPGYQNWKLAILYYSQAGYLCTGATLILLGATGVVCAAMKKMFGPLLFLMLTPVFYVWSMHSASTPIFVPSLWPYTYYNSRYGIPLVVLSSFAVGAIVPALRQRWRKLAFVLPLLSVAPWLIPPAKENWICWKESQVNSASRRQWTAAAAEFLRHEYRSGEGILISSASGDPAGILCSTGIPLRELIYMTNDDPAWWANTIRPDLLHQAFWVIAQAGDPIAKALGAPSRSGYRARDKIQVEGAPALEIYERTEAEAER